MGEERKSIYDDLERELRGFPVGDYVQAYAKAYFEADVETIRKLQELLLGNIAERTEPDPPPSPSQDAPVGAPIKPRPHLNSGAVAVPLPDEADH
jgi:hypothetical protein